MKTIHLRGIHFKKRQRSSHKGDNGRVLVIGGSQTYPGAAALCGLAALRAGCDWVTIACPEKVAWAINCLTPDIVTVKLHGGFLRHVHLDAIASLAKRHDVLALGNGIGLQPPTQRLVHHIVKHVNKPMIIDADALKILSLDEPRDAVLTPHAGEFRTLMKNSHIALDAGHAIPWKTVQKKLRTNILLLKGPTDYIVSNNRIMVNTMHDPSMTKAGTGDVLAGLCAGFYAQGYTAFDAACMAAYFNGLTGRLLSQKQKHPSLIASDLVRDIPAVLTRQSAW